VAAALLYLEARPYYPAVRIAAPGEVTYTALLDSTEDAESCDAAARRFVSPIAGACPQCRVLFTRCEHSALSLPSEDAPRYWVESKGVRIAVAGPEANARQSCELIAADLAKRGIAGARCTAK
jgi:hypothetical protein